MIKYDPEKNPYLAKDEKGHLVHLDNDWWPKHLGWKEGYEQALRDVEPETRERERIHRDMMDGIENAIGDLRERRHTGEPARSDVYEISRLAAFYRAHR